MDAEDLFASANEALQDEDFPEAKRLFDLLLQQTQTNPSYYSGRSATNLKMGKYEAALADAESALKLSPANATANLRAAMALFHLDRFAEAKQAFIKSESGGKKASLWIRKCDAELEHAGGGGGAAVGNGSGAAAAAKPKAPLVSAVNIGPQPSAENVRESFFQSQQAATVTLFIKKLTKENVQVEFESQAFRVVIQCPDGTVFNKRWSLYAPIDEARSSWHVTPYKVDVILTKQSAVDWPKLEAPVQAQQQEVVAVRPNTISEGINATKYPSSKKDVDWEQLEQDQKKEEAEEKPEGQEALHKLFQQIYKDADEDTRRAMIKSYQTSGGTVLSTNWKEVKERDYEKEIQAPKGQEVRKWND